MSACRLIEKSISSVYELVRQMHLGSCSTSSGVASDLAESTNASIKKSFVDLPKDLFEMLSTVGPYLYRNAILLQKVLYFLLCDFTVY